jgi:hypothetical protein
VTNSATVVSRGSEFDAFLYASIGEEKNGMLLSVLSVLARLDIDPWQEAAELARMSIETANQRLTSLIEALPDGSSTRPEPGAIAARLIALLPRGARPLTTTSGETWPRSGAAANSRTFMYVVLVNLLFMVAQWTAASLHTPAMVDSTTHASMASAGDQQNSLPR